jgi:uncharacterized membrane protein YraQ (UPF0718 family)
MMFQFQLIFPYWISGVVAGSLISVFAAAKIKQILSGMKQEEFHIGIAFLAALLGVASPVCMYGTVPLLASLGKKAVPQYLLVTFMISSILLNPNLLLMSFALGTKTALFRLFTSIAAGLTAGILVKIFFQNKKIFKLESFPESESNKEKPANLKQLAKDLNRSIMITAPYFLAGIAMTALMDRYFPNEILVNLFVHNKGLGVLLATSMGVPVYLCGGGTIPLIRYWLRNGMSIGSAVAFMVSGPATKLTNLSAVKVILGFKNFILYLIFNIVLAILAGIAADLISPLI